MPDLKNISSCGNFDSGDISIIKKQLNSRNVSICKVAKRCRYKFPQIVFLNPVIETGISKRINHEAISNLMWLTCPYLNWEIHELENATYIKKIKQIIQNDPVFKEMMAEAQANYFFFRSDLFRPHSALITGKEADMFKNGIGGMRDLTAIKCLHLHFCHYIFCKENVAGCITWHLLNKKTECDEAYCNSLNHDSHD